MGWYWPFEKGASEEAHAKRVMEAMLLQASKVPLPPEVVSEEVATESMRRQRRKKGRATTLLTGDLTVPAERVGKSKLLGA